MNTLTVLIALFFMFCASSQAQVIIKKENQTKKGDEEIYAEFQKMVKGGLDHKGFLLDKTGKLLPIYMTTITKPQKKVRSEPIGPKINVGMSKNEVIKLLGYPDDYLLVIKPGQDPNDIKQDIVEEQWFYGKTTVIFERKNDNIVRIDIEK